MNGTTTNDASTTGAGAADAAGRAPGRGDANGAAATGTGARTASARAPATPAPATAAGAAATTEPAVALRDLSRRYGRQLVLRGISLEVAPGRVVALRGRNGSGKTTLLRLLATRLRPSGGQARIFDFDLVKEAPRVRERIAYLSVHGGSYGALTARENLRLAATLLGRPAAEVDAALARVGLEAHADRLVRVFSSGMKRRLGLARLVLTDAPLWLLDEPYASLDEEGRGLVDDLLREARASGRTVLLASHEPERIAPLVDGVLEIEQGRLRAAKPATTATTANAEVADVPRVANEIAPGSETRGDETSGEGRQP